MISLLMVVFYVGVLWLVRRDTKQRPGLSGALWIPTVWLAILASRPLSFWVGAGGGVDTLEGSPLDRAFYFVLILVALLVLSRRSIAWGTLIGGNWPLVFFYAYLLLTVLWANDPFVSSKRWLKESGNIIMALVVLTEVNPVQAFRAVFIRCAYLLIPLSILLIRYFPALGRVYNRHSGELEAVGVTFQKNSLGTMVLVCGLVLLWDWIATTKEEDVRRTLIDRWIPPVMLAIGAWLLLLCDSKTSLLCLVVGGGVVSLIRLPFFRRRVRILGVLAVTGVLLFMTLDSVFGITEHIVTSMGRDMTFTGRTDVWKALLGVGTDPLFGAGYMSFWDNDLYRSRLPSWVASSAHNGYIEMYIAGGVLGLFALGVMLFATGFRLNRALATEQDYAVARFAVFVVTLLANFSETNFACMTPVGFIFLLAAIGEAPRVGEAVAAPALKPVRLPGAKPETSIASLASLDLA